MKASVLFIPGLVVICFLMFSSCIKSSNTVSADDADDNDGIPGQTILQAQVFEPINLAQYNFNDTSRADWSISGQKNLIVTLDSNFIVNIETPSEHWTGSDTLQFFLQQGANEASFSAVFKVKAVVILVSMDGFRWDYCSKTETNSLDELAAGGVKAESLIPVYPSRTFPNHLSIVTGLYPENHGIISNRMYDAEWDAWYYIGEGSVPVRESRWYEGEPIWVTAEKQGVKAAIYFWPGSEAEFDGVQASHWYYYRGSVPNHSRVDQIHEWLDLPDGEQPGFLAFYFSDTDTWGHEFGPDSDDLLPIIEKLDDDIGYFMDGLKQRDIFNNVNILVTSDHGMTAVDPDSIIFLEDYINLDDVRLIEWNTSAMMNPHEGKENIVYNQLKDKHDKMHVYRRNEMPEHLHYRNHRRIPSIIAMADPGWIITTREFYNRQPSRYTGGLHGYTPDCKEMHGIFFARGPSFENGITAAPFQNIQIYNIIADILGIEPVSNDGDFEAVNHILVQ